MSSNDLYNRHKTRKRKVYFPLSYNLLKNYTTYLSAYLSLIYRSGPLILLSAHVPSDVVGLIQALHLVAWPECIQTHFYHLWIYHASSVHQFVVYGRAW